ncbi:DUF6204 family protein [Streptomyces gelaticus]|uniref:DUF6204 family protein n=1 Tax=Streptomyces gelaticus TaxID=285446 RepID=UPI00167B64BD|nr:DUF6204 family protein [Streptomyces gelaticus]
MSDRTYRVIVRGTFADLDEAQRAALIENAAEHDLLNATLTDEGTLTYELPPRAFTFRCVVRQPADADDDAAVQRACDRAAADLANRGIRHSALRGTATSLDDMKIRRPRR